jgi:hypothetical protein
MSDKSTILRTFNKHFFEFIEDVVRIFPDNMDVKNSKTSFELIKMGNLGIFLYIPHIQML